MGKPKSGSKSKGGRGGGKLFIANIEELQLRDREISEAQEARARRRAEDGEDGAAAAEESEGEQEEESGQEKVSNSELIN